MNDIEVFDEGAGFLFVVIPPLVSLLDVGLRPHLPSSVGLAGAASAVEPEHVLVRLYQGHLAQVEVSMVC